MEKLRNDRCVADEVGLKIRILRNRHNLSMRQLAKQAGVTTSYIAGLEAGRTSPTISTLCKLMAALETDLSEFFSANVSEADIMVFRHQSMRRVEDGNKECTFALPRRPNIHVEMVEEVIKPTKTKPGFETLHSELAGCVLDGELMMEMENQEPQLFRPHDAFYIPAGRPVRSWAHLENKPVRLITIYTPPRH